MLFPYSTNSQNQLTPFPDIELLFPGRDPDGITLEELKRVCDSITGSYRKSGLQKKDAIVIVAEAYSLVLTNLGNTKQLVADILDGVYSFDRLEEYLRKYKRHILFFTDTQSTALRYLFPLRALITCLEDEYDSLDRKKGFRTDGSTRISHIWETVIILIDDLDHISKESLIVTFLHDYLEDTEKPREEAETWIRTTLANIEGVDIDRILNMIRSLTKKPLKDYIKNLGEEGEGYIHLSLDEKKAYILKHKQRLRGFQQEEYYGSLPSLEIEAFLIKLADRLHALHHFDKNPREKVIRKVEECKTYFLPALERRIQESSDPSIQKSLKKASSLMEKQINIIDETLRRFPDDPYKKENETKLRKA